MAKKRKITIRTIMEGSKVTIPDGHVSLAVALMLGKADSTFMRSTDAGRMYYLRGEFCGINLLTDVRTFGNVMLLPDSLDVAVLLKAGQSVEFAYVICLERVPEFATVYSKYDLIGPRHDAVMERLLPEAVSEWKKTSGSGGAV